MKKKLTLIIFIFISYFAFNINAYAKDPTLSQVTCSYNGSGKNLEIRYSYTPAAGVYLTVRTMNYTINSQNVYSYDINGSGMSTYPEAYKNLNQALMVKSDDGKQWIPINYTTQGYFMSHIDEAVNSGTETPLCPSKFYIGKKDNSYEFYACGMGENLNGNEVDFCPLTKKYAEQENTEVIELSLNNNTKVQTDSNYFDGSDSNVTDVYVEIATKEEELVEQEQIYCDTNNSSYNITTCNEIKQKLEEIRSVKGNVETQADATGITKEELEKEFIGFKSNVKIDFNTEKGCESYLGNPKDNINKPPAYYLQFTFNLIKYVAIILLFVLSIVDYGKAVASSNQDAIKKATMNTVKRIIIAAVVFMLPVLIEFLFKVLGLYSSTTCGIK